MISPMQLAIKTHLLERFLVKLKKKVVKVVMKLQNYWQITSAEVLCNLICFYYPAMKTIMEIEVEEKINFNQWTFYWVTFGLFAIVVFYF
ncbi:Receptor expression-enhancing protein 5 [Trichinella patagoniensis]|uniref:Receptor expression-enhancing protein 5 n=1 Tax=Trichinella patagoniensis TaxID=990121 RepID=A0A0V1A953_9BILA|nr:Receptor expression-enhancing protein 5 [Trichinella patagoniensis]